MTSKEFAEMLTGRNYMEEISPEEKKIAKEDGLVVVFGCSDDNTEFCGAIDDEVGSYDGAEIFVTKSGLLCDPGCQNYDREECPFYAAAKKSAQVINAVWHDEGNPCWTFKTDIPHETFEIFDDGELWCIGIVFSISDI